MCGILGCITKIPIAKETFRDANDLMRHRGPDDSGTLHLKSLPWHIALGNRRLSIIDLTPWGRQPMANEDNTLWIVYNGEIYNFPEIRQELVVKGHIFRSNTDTEVILHAYEEWGTDCLHKLNGMFAFAIWDSGQKRLFMARDRLGVKPLYYTRIKDGLAFASEIKALLHLPGVKREMNLKALGKYLAFLWVPDPSTLFEGIYKLPPGHYALFRDGQLTIQPYWDLRFPEEPKHTDEEKACEELLEKLRLAVRRRLVSDVPLGVFLSGGLDSSLITVLMQEFIEEPIIACSIGFRAEDLQYDIIPDDLKYARMVRDILSAHLDYREILLRPEIIELLPKLIWHLDEPVADPAAISTYLICEAAKERATVMLTGAGGEEIFAGYPRHLGMKLARYYSHIPTFLRNGFLHPLIECLPASRPGPFLASFRNLKKFIRSTATHDFTRQYLNMRSYYMEKELKALLIAPHLADGVYEEHLSYFERVKDIDPLHQLLYVDTKTFLPCLNLTYIDKASMAASVEVREPLLDYELVEFVAMLPPKLKLKGFTQKHILKKAAERLLPKEIVYRKKAGFGGPVRAWVMRDLQPLIRELLSKDVIKQRGLLRYEAVEKLLKDQFSGQEDNALRIWALITLELWLRMFIDRDGSAPISLEVVQATSQT